MDLQIKSSRAVIATDSAVKKLIELKAAEPGENRYNTYSSVYPVMKVSLSNNMGDGPSIDAQVAASKEFVDKIDESNYQRVRKNFSSFKEDIMKGVQQ